MLTPKVAAATAVAALAFAPTALADSPAPGTLTTSGSGSVMVTPDQGSLSISVNRTASTSAVALSNTNRHVDAIVAAARALSIPSSQIQTENVSSSCHTVKVGPKGHKHGVRRCSADQDLTITTTTGQLGAVIDAATKAGASSIDGPDFSFSNPSAGEIAAENKAIADAQAQADASAAQLGYTVTGVQSVQLNPQSGESASSFGAVSAAPVAKSSVPTTVKPGKQEVDATVSVVFTIAPAPTS